MKILIVGGYGTFGGRLADLLLDRPELELVIAGRDGNSAAAFCAVRQEKAKARLTSLVFDRTQPNSTVAAVKPDLVVDASGPFQTYGAGAYALVQAAIDNGCNYADLADGAAFVEGISTLDQLAKSKGVFAVSGMSSFPVLTAAVGRELARKLDVVNEIQAGIAPSPYAGVGMNVIRAIASYAGQPVKIKRDGAWGTAIGFFDSKIMQVNVPGTVPLSPIRFALAEVPDLKVLSWLWPEAKSIWMGAGPTPALLHRLLWLAAGGVKLGLLRSLLPLAPVMNFVVNTVRWGEHRGGLIFEMKGTQSGQQQTLSWHLLAEGDGGPLIPSMAVAALAGRMLAGHQPAPGARPGHEDLTLADYQPWFDRYGIKTGIRSSREEEATLYQWALGEAYGRLAPPIRSFHAHHYRFSMRGRAQVTGSVRPVARLLRRIFGFPAPGQEVAVEVDLDIDGQREIWLRKFDGRPMRSIQRKGKGRNAGLVIESFGPLNFAMAVVENEGTLGLVVRQWDILGLPLPRSLLPRVKAEETGLDNRFNFSVAIELPFFGQLVGYRGHLIPR